MAVTSLVLGILALVFPFIGMGWLSALVGIIGIILGALGRKGEKRGLATAGLVITVVNIVGGIAMGVLRQGLDIGSALEKYTILTIGDGLVSQIPSLLISLSTGILVTKGSKDADFGTVLIRQLFGVPKVLYLVGTIIIALGVVTPLPTVIFLTLGLIFIVCGRVTMKRTR